MENTDRISRNPDIVHSYLEEHIVMMNVETGHYYHFNEVGTRVWELLENGALSLERLADQIKSEFNADKDEIRRDIISFVSEISEGGLVRISK